jgi:GntR family transcriptional regulator of vanillate catabolism
MDLPIGPVERTRLVDEVTNHLRRAIVDGILPPGQALLQGDLSEKLGISRTPLREALRVLEREGFVRVSNGNKTLEVIDLTAADMLEVYQFREVIDGLAARLAARRALAEQSHAHLVGLVDQMARTSASTTPSTRADAHAEFHSAIALLSGNRYVVGQIPMIRLTAQMLARALQTLQLEDPAVGADMIEQGADDHQAIIEAIRTGDAGAAESIARRHIRKTMQSPLLSAAQASSDALRPID